MATEYIINSASDLDQLDLVAGDVVIMKNGEWTNQNLKFKGVGTAELPITLRAETSGHVILNGSSTLDMSGEYLVVDGLRFYKGSLNSGHVIEFRTSSSELANNCRLTNTKIQDYNPASVYTEYKWVSVYGKNNRVDHCEFTGKNHEGALLVIWLDRSDNPTPNYTQIDHNYFGEISEFEGGNGAEAIRIGTSDYSMQDSRAVVEYNLFEACDGEIEIISNKSCYNTYRYNTFRKSAGTLTLRHGSDCEVYGNFFFGEGKNDSGGIRIIGERHKVYNNYLQDLNEDGFRGAIVMTNGVPDSPLNRYFQVIDAEVVNNTIVNCKYPMVIGAGADDELTLPPLNCTIANNVIARYSGSMHDMVSYEDDPINMTYQNNLFYGGDLGITPPSGIEITDPMLEANNDFYRPGETSPVFGYGSTDYDYITSDIDGQNRTSRNDAGADQISEETILNQPLTKENVGVAWTEWLKEVSAAEGGSKLSEYIATANTGDVIILTTSGGQYKIESSATLTSNILIKSSDELDTKPIISANAEVNEFIMLGSECSLEIRNIDFSGTNLQNVFAVENGTVDSLVITNCDFSKISQSIVNASGNAVISKLEINNSRNYDLGAPYSFTETSYPDGFEIENSSFINIDGSIISINESANSFISLNHLTIDNTGFASDETPVFSFAEATVLVSNAIFSHCGLTNPSFSVEGSGSEVNYCAFWETEIPATSNGILGANNWHNIDPEFASREQLNFTLLPTSFALNAASDGENLGDLYWNIENGHPDNNAFLQEIIVNGTPLNGFDAQVLNYNVQVPDGENYTVEATAQSETAEVKVHYPNSIPGQVFIEVTAENEINNNYYVLNVSIGTSVNENPFTHNLALYPNPNNGAFTIKCNTAGKIKLYDASGIIIKSMNLVAYKHIRCSDLPTGLYILEYTTRNYTHVQKVIVE